MGVLEIADLPELIGLELQPYYKECTIKLMFNEERLTPPAIKTFSTRFAEMFDQIARMPDLRPLLHSKETYNPIELSKKIMKYRKFGRTDCVVRHWTGHLGYGKSGTRLPRLEALRKGLDLGMTH